MSRDEIMTLDLEQLEERAAQIETDSVGIDEERLLEFNTELEAIEEIDPASAAFIASSLSPYLFFSWR